MTLAASVLRLAPIGDIAEVRPGLSTGARLESTPNGTHQVVLSRHLTPGLPYSFEPSHEFRITPDRDVGSRYEVTRGDVLFMSRGERNVASWIESVPSPSIAPVSFYVIRPRQEIDAGFLTWYLNQPQAQKEIADIRTGAGTPLVQRSSFECLLLPVPDMSTQRNLAALGAAMARERQLRERLNIATARLHELTSEQIARALLARTENSDGE